MNIAEKTAAELVKEPLLRGDPMSGERYHDHAFMAQEWEAMWTKVWHIGALTAQLENPGDVVTYDIGRESILMTRGEDGVIRAYYNVCPHRGNRLVRVEEAHLPKIVCSYHGWTFDSKGQLRQAQNPEDFPQGNPCGKRNLKEIPCETWGGFVWFNMNPDATSVRDYLGVVADQLAVYDMENMVRVQYMTVEVECNWKVIQDNFNESYHLPTLHTELNSMIEDDYRETVFELYQSGHNRMQMKGGLPAYSAGSQTIQEPLAEIMKEWELDPQDFVDKPREIRLALQQQKRRLGPKRGNVHYDKLSDDQLTDFHHYTLFPNLSLTMSAEGFQILRPQPHPKDPEKCYFDHWFFVPKVPGREEVAYSAAGIGGKLEPAEHDVFKHGEKSAGFVADQDLSIAVGQQLGFHSRAYDDAYLSHQERRVRRFHEVLNDYLAKRRPASTS